MMLKSSLLVLVMLTPAICVTTTTTTVTTVTTTTTVAATTTTVAATTTTVAVVPKTTENVTANTTEEPALTLMLAAAAAGDTVLQVVDIIGFTVGMDIVIDPGKPNMEFNTIKALGTIDLATPLVFPHPKGTVVAKKKADETTTTIPVNPCVPTTTTLPKPCVPMKITTTKGPCDAIPVKKYDAAQNQVQPVGNTLGMV